MSAWPSNLLTVYISPPFVSARVANVWRAVWSVTFFFIPAVFAQSFNCRFIACSVGISANTKSSSVASPRSGRNFLACSDSGKYSGACVFCCRILNRQRSPSFSMSIHRKAFTSEIRNPQKQIDLPRLLFFSRCFC